MSNPAMPNARIITLLEPARIFLPEKTNLLVFPSIPVGGKGPEDWFLQVRWADPVTGSNGQAAIVSRDWINHLNGEDLPVQNFDAVLRSVTARMRGTSCATCKKSPPGTPPPPGMLPGLQPGELTPVD